jgi:hypothetical protein
MKSIVFISIVVLSQFFASCEREDIDNDSVSNIITQGSWRVTSYVKDGANYTNYFTGFNFTFNANGNVIASRNATAVNGTWRAVIDSQKEKLIISFGLVQKFDELNEDWVVEEKTRTKIKLTHVSGGNATTDVVVLEP